MLRCGSARLPSFTPTATGRQHAHAAGSTIARSSLIAPPARGEPCGRRALAAALRGAQRNGAIFNTMAAACIVKSHSERPEDCDGAAKARRPTHVTRRRTLGSDARAASSSGARQAMTLEENGRIAIGVGGERKNTCAKPAPAHAVVGPRRRAFRRRLDRRRDGARRLAIEDAGRRRSSIQVTETSASAVRSRSKSSAIARAIDAQPLLEPAPDEGGSGWRTSPDGTRPPAGGVERDRARRRYDRRDAVRDRRRPSAERARRPRRGGRRRKHGEAPHRRRTPIFNRALQRPSSGCVSTWVSGFS